MRRKYKTDIHLHKIVTTLLFIVVFSGAMAQSYRPPVFADKNRNAKIAATYTRLDSLFKQYAAPNNAANQPPNGIYVGYFSY